MNAAAVAQTIDIPSRAGGVIMESNFSAQHVNDIVQAIRKVYRVVTRA